MDRYMVNGVYRETMLSPRELNIAGLPSAAQTWVNQHITYTHGYGVAMSAVNQVTTDGSPDFLVQDIPPASAPGLQITQPRIYYGERGTDYSLVKTKDQEFDYPGPNSRTCTRPTTAAAASPSRRFINRLAFCVRFGTIKFFTTSAIDSQSRIIIRNNIDARITAAAPVPHSWTRPLHGHRRRAPLLDRRTAYTTTKPVPVLDAAGRPQLHPQLGEGGRRRLQRHDRSSTSSTPATRCCEPTPGIFPGMFTPARARCPPTLLAHVRYPEDYFNTQAEVCATYHVSNPDVLYNKGDQWQIPTNVSLSGAGPMDAYYVMMRLPGTAKGGVPPHAALRAQRPPEHDLLAGSPL